MASISEPGERSGALFDDSGAYRYRLWRVWNPDLPRCAFVLLNPSTADAERDDPTIRRCIGFARAWGHGSVEVVNLFAFRATHPADLKCAADPVGPDNDRHLREVLADATRVVFGWGCHGSLFGRAAAFRDSGLLPASALCFGVTRAGEPRHPLYVRGDAFPEVWPPLPPNNEGRREDCAVPSPPALPPVLPPLLGGRGGHPCA